MVMFPSGEDRSTFADADSALRVSDFLADVIATSQNGALTEMGQIYVLFALQNYLLREDGECPQVFSMVWMRHVNSNGWRKMYMLLQGRKLYTAKKVSLFMKIHVFVEIISNFYFAFF